MTEVWKDIPGYEGRYQVSDQGRVRSVDRLTSVNSGKDGRKSYTRKEKGKLLVPTGERYLGVCLGRYPTKQNVHNLVMLAFVGPCPEGQEVCHNNGNAFDNRLCNLRYDSRSENVRDQVRHRGRKITLNDVNDIIKARANGVPCRTLAKKYGLSEAYVCHIGCGRTHKWSRK